MSKKSVIVFGFCTSVWIIKTICEIIIPNLTTKTFMIGDIICSVLFSIAFIDMLIRYLSDK